MICSPATCLHRRRFIVRPACVPRPARCDCCGRSDRARRQCHLVSPDLLLRLPRPDEVPRPALVQHHLRRLCAAPAARSAAHLSAGQSIRRPTYPPHSSVIQTDYQVGFRSPGRSPEILEIRPDSIPCIEVGSRKTDP